MFGTEIWSGFPTVKSLVIAVSTPYRHVTDRQTDRQMDGQTSCHGIVRAYAEYRAVAVNCMAIMPNMLHFGTAFGDLADVAKM